MEKDPKVFLQHILQSIDLVEDYIKDKNKEDILKSEMLQDALVRRLEIIGEAGRNIPDSLCAQYPQIPWQDISDMRNKLIHEYFIVDMEIVWQVIERDLPLLKKQIKEVLEEIKK